MKKIIILLSVLVLLAVSVTAFSSCKENPIVAPETPPETEPKDEETPADPQEQQPQETEEAPENPEEKNEEVNDVSNPIATIEMEDGGKIVVELMPNYAPNTVANFISLAQSGFYDGVIIHRIVPGFVIQGGDPDGTGMGGPGYAIKGEFIQNGFEANRLSHTKGVISMARTMAPNSAGSQFFIVLDDAAIPSLDAQYAGFGMVIEGMEIVDQIATVERDAGDKPIKDVVIKTITIDTKGVEWQAPETIEE